MSSILAQSPPVGLAAAAPARTAHAPAPLAHGGVLDALRFLAAVCMVIYHFSFSSPVPLAQIHPLFARGYLATDFFLVVSGYVLGRIYGERVAGSAIGALEFFKRRCLRLVPAHLMMILAFIGLLVSSAAVGIAPQHPEYLAWPDLPAELFLVQAFGVPGGVGWNGPSWSLSALLGCYLLFPPVWRAQARIKSPLLVLGLALAFMLACDLASWATVHVPIYQFPARIGFLRAVPLFFLGGALARVSQALSVPPTVAKLGALFATLGVCAVQLLGQYDLVSILLIATLVVSAGAIPVKTPSEVLKTAALVSFAIFITNEFVRFVYVGVQRALTHGRTLSAPVAWAGWWAAVASALAFAVAFHYLVDMPTQRFIKRVRKGGWRAGFAAAPGGARDTAEATA